MSKDQKVPGETPDYPRSVIATYSGVAFDLAKPRVEDIRLGDIAHALSHICRFTGHVKRFYSVAEHSLLVHDLVKAGGETDVEVLRGALLHDAHEAYTGDVSTPLKSQIGDVLSPIADDVDWTILRWLIIHRKWANLHDDIVKAADRDACYIEAVALLPAATWAWDRENVPAVPQGVNWFAGLRPAEQVKADFLSRAHGLGL